MRIGTVTALGLFAVGALLTWATDGVVGGADAETIGAILMIASGAGLLALILVATSRNAAAQRGAPEGEPVDEPDDRLTAMWPRR
jgi:hypothetical protein